MNTSAEDKNGIVFRKMGKKDIDGVLHVENRSFTIPWSKGMFLEELKNDNAFYEIALKDENIVGYAGMWIIIDEAHITNIAVDPLFRRRHIASGLMHRIFKKARECNLKGLTLEVRAGNVAAIEFYKMAGFTVEGRRKGYYSDNREDALIMWCYPNKGDGLNNT